MSAIAPKLMAAALMVAFVLSMPAPARSIEAATPDDTARFLAGLPPAPNSPLAPFTQDALWQQHARNFDALFAREESNSLSKIRAFSQERLTDKHATLLYMFSGPDFLYANAFFPTASTYVLSALEPIGTIPQVTSLAHSTIDATLRNLEASMGTLLNYSFFITKDMRVQLNEGPVFGVLPILYVFLARTGMTIHEVSFVGLDRYGNFLTPDQPDGKRKAVSTAAPGVKIVFSEGNAPRRTLYYFTTNLADGNIEVSGFIPFCIKLGPADSFLKSASYLMHKSAGFNKVREFLLDHSVTILQDDSGIPIAFFDPKKWRLQAFGHYDGPLSIFGTPYQERLGELFRKGSATPIDFGVGYRWHKNESNLMLAEKIATSDNELAPRLPVDGNVQRTDHPLPKTAPKRVESDPAASADCGTGSIFSFCSTPQPKPSR